MARRKDEREGHVDRRRGEARSGVGRLSVSRALIVAALGSLALASLALASLAVASTSVGAGPPGTVRIGSAPRAPNGARPIGPVSLSATVTGAVVLKPRDNAALVRFISDVTNKQSPLFHRYLAPGEFAGRFGPTQATIDAVRSKLQADGLRVGGVASDGLFVRFTGTAGRVESAFHTGLESYRLADGTTGRAATAAASVPSAIAGSVAAVVGLNDLARRRPAGILRAPASARGSFPAARTGQFVHPPGSPAPCAAAQADALSSGGLTDDQIAHAYGAFGLYGAGDLGAGQRIAVYELEPFLVSDVKTFDTCYFGASQATSMIGRLSVVPVDGGQPAGSGSGEAILDIQDVAGMAPGASIDVYEAPNTTFGAVDEYSTIINSDRDRVVTSSWGLCEQAVQLGEPGIQQAEHSLFEQAAAQGQTVLSAAGDTGSDDCNAFRPPAPASGQNPLSLDDPASQPYVISVGGTTIDNAATQPPQEHVWNDGAQWGAGGGGIAMSWAMPTWQLSSQLPGIALPGSPDYTNANSVETRFGYPSNFCQSFVPGATASTPCRLTPDVSAQADEFTGAVTVYSASFGSGPNAWITIGGTSSAAPIWAALLAVANASPTCAANAATRNGVGFASPLLYAVASNPGDYAASFNDITSGNNDNYGLDNGLVFPATTGFDLATGLGSPQLTGAGGTAGLAYYLCSFATHASRPLVSRLSPTVGSTAGGLNVTITGRGFESGGAADVAGIQIGSWRIPASRFRVVNATTIIATMPPASDTLPPAAPRPQDGAGPVNVIVTLTNGESSAPGPGSTFEYVDERSGNPMPSVTGVSPYGGREIAPGQVTIFGSGFTGATSVTFGAVAAPSFKVMSPYRIAVTPPTYSSHQACSPLPTTGVYAGENATNDICQVQVRVSNTNGTSSIAKILPPLEGAVAFNSEGVVAPPPGCNCEVAPAASEFDYTPAAKISSVSTSSGPASLANENGGTLITVHGAGLNLQTLDWSDIGAPSQASSIDTAFVFVTGTEMQVTAPAQPPTVDALTLPFSVKNLAGQSPSKNLTYAGVPNVTAVVNTINSTQLNGSYGGPDTGRTPIQVSGGGFNGQLLRVQFTDSNSPFSLGTQYSFTTASDTSLSTQTVAQNPAIVDVQACTVSGCSVNPPADLFYLYPPGDPKVDSISPTSGPAAGGTKTVISGENLGCPLSVFFGNVQAASFTPVQTFLDCGSTAAVDATSPPGTSRTKLPVTVTTVESYFTGSGRSQTNASFTYTP